MKCPICNKEFTERPALSRKDNKTEICPECGMREAIEAAMTVRQRTENDKREILNKITKNYYTTIIVYNNTLNKILFTANTYEELFDTLEVVKNEEKEKNVEISDYKVFYSIDAFNRFLEEKLGEQYE